ncbi:MAG: ABC transporter permease [Prolixibacteraceae bacterium]
MNQLKLVLRSIKHYFSANIWLALGVAITTAVITGGLIVGDSVKYSLEQTAHLRLGEITHALTSGDRYFTNGLAERMNEEGIQSSAALKQEAVASSNGGQLTLNKVNVWGLDNNFSAVSGLQHSVFNDEGDCSISLNTATRLNLKVGDDILLKIEKASLIPANAPFVSDEDQTVTLRISVTKILTDVEMGRLNLQTSQTAPFNVFVAIQQLNELMDLEGKANVLFISTSKNTNTIEAVLQQKFTLEDASLSIVDAPASDQWELHSGRVFIDDVLVHSIENSGLEYTPIFTYFTNYFKLGEQKTPYSFISTLPDYELEANEIVINTWLANDLKARVGDSIELGYFNMGALRQLTEVQKTFVVKEIVPIEGYFADQTLMPQIPGLSDSESCRDWQTGVPVDLKSIRDQDEDYWYQYRGLPKAFVAFSTAQKLWSNRYGSVTTFRFDRQNLSKLEVEQMIKDQLNPFMLDFQLRSVKDDGLSAAKNGTDFSSLFIGLSFFILVSGIILIVLLFRFNLERRTGEIGTLSSLGFSNKKIRSIFLHEGMIVARTGAALGLLMAIGYNKLVFWGLNQVWNDIVRTEVLVPKIKISTLLIGFVVSLAVALFTIWLTLNKKLKQSTATLQRKTISSVSTRVKVMVKVVAWLSFVYGLFTVAMELLKTDGLLNSGAFFMAGGLLLLAFILFFYLFLLKEPGKTSGFKRNQLLGQNIRMNRTRSLTVVLLLAIGTYLVVSTGMNRKDLFSNANDPHSGTGGFLFWAETTVPVLHDMNNSSYRNEQGFSTEFETVQMRVVEGDDASCLNLNRISNPRILGLDPSQLTGRFSAQAVFEESADPDLWKLLKQEHEDCIPAIADQTVLQWSLGKKVGDTLIYQNALGDEVKLLMVAGLNASVFQGNVVIDQENFLKNFPSSSGTQVFLIDGEKELEQAIADDLDLIYRDFGMELTPAPQRLAEFMSITNTYLSIFLVLGALGLLIGTVGLAIILQRSLLERKAEFALLSSLGFTNKFIYRLVVSEYLILLLVGIVVGFISAVISVYPSIQSSIESISISFVAELMAGILLNGLIWIAVLAALQLRKMKVVEALRND